MADNKSLTPGTNDAQPPSFLNYSRGFDSANSAVGQGLTSFGETVGKAIQLADQYNVNAIQDEVRQTVETLDTRYIGTTLGGDTKLPEAATTQIKNLERMKAAAAQGKVSPEHYYSVLQVKAKEIRSKYGDLAYADEIDKAFSNLLGTTPANALRKIVAHEAERAANKAATEATHNRSLLDSIVKGGLTQNGQIIQRAAMPGAENDPVFMAQARLAVGKDQAFKAQMAQEVQLLHLKKARNEDTADEAGKLVRNFTTKQLQDLMTNVPEYKQLQDMEAQARQAKLSGKAVDPQLEDNLRVMVNAIKARGEAIKRDMYTTFGNVPGVDAKTIQQSAEFVDTVIKSTADRITNKEYGAVGLNAATVHGIKDATTVNFLQTSNVLRSYDALKDIVGREVWPTIHLQVGGAAINQPIVDGIAIAQTHDMATKVATSLSQDFTPNPNLTGKDAAEANAKSLGHLTAMMTSPNGIADKAVMNNLVNKVFSDGGKEFMSRIGDTKVRDDFFYKMASPAAFNNVKAIASSGYPQVMQNYKSFISDGLLQTMRQTVDRAAEFNNETRTQLIKYNPATKQFEVVAKTNEGLLPPAAGFAAVRDSITSDARHVIDELNKAMIVADGVAKNTGEPIERIVGPAIEQIGRTTDKQPTEENRVESYRQREQAKAVVEQLLKSGDFMSAVQSNDPRAAAAAIGRMIVPPVRP